MFEIHSTDKCIKPGIYMSLSAVYTHKAKAVEVYHTVRRAMPVLKKIMNIDPDVVIRIAPIKAKATNGRYWNGSKVAEIDCRLDWNKALEVLCHEMVHCEQYFTGRLQQVPSSRGLVHKWNGSVDFNKGSTYKAYRDQPWEQEAWSRQAQLCEQVMKALGE